MTMMAETPMDGIEIPDVRPVPVWRFSRRNLVKVTYIGEGSRTPKTFVGRITNVTEDVITLLRISTGEPLVINRDRIRSCVVMVEGDVGGRARATAVRAMVRATRALADPKHVGGDVKIAADMLAYVLKMFPELREGDPEAFWNDLQTMGVEIE